MIELDLSSVKDCFEATEASWSHLGRGVESQVVFSQPNCLSKKWGARGFVTQAHPRVLAPELTSVHIDADETHRLSLLRIKGKLHTFYAETRSDPVWKTSCSEVGIACNLITKPYFGVSTRSSSIMLKLMFSMQ